MIKAIPKTFLSGNFDLFDGGRWLGSLDVAPWKDKGTVRIGQDRYEISRNGWFARRFEILGNGVEIGRAYQPSLFSRSFELELDGQSYYRAEPARKLDLRDFRIRRENQDAGEITGQNNYRGTVTIRCLPEVPVTDQLALFCIAHLLWDRTRFFVLGLVLLPFFAFSQLEWLSSWLLGP